MVVVWNKRFDIVGGWYSGCNTCGGGAVGRSGGRPAAALPADRCAGKSDG